MSIFKITHKEYRKAMRVRKSKPKDWEAPALYFEDEELGGYYKCTTKGMAGVKEIAEFKKDRKAHLCVQMSLL